jgi:hypothetical protein
MKNVLHTAVPRAGILVRIKIMLFSLTNKDIEKPALSSIILTTFDAGS